VAASGCAKEAFAIGRVRTKTSLAQTGIVEFIRYIALSLPESFSSKTPRSTAWRTRYIISRGSPSRPPLASYQRTMVTAEGQTCILETSQAKAANSITLQKNSQKP
jgi:hypothetical protein